MLEFVPNQKISYTWGHEDIVGFPQTIVTWQLEQIGNDKTKVELVHSGFVGAEDEMYDEHREGWNYYLDRLIEHFNSKLEAKR